MASKLTITDERIEKIAVWLATESHSLNLEMLTCLRELQERRKAERDSEPVALINGAWTLVYYRPPKDLGLKIGDKLYRHAQQSVVPDRSIFEIWWESQNGAPLDGWDSLRTTDGYCDDGIDGQFEAWNAAMLQAGSSPVIPGWIPVSELMPEERETVVLVADERGIVWCAEIQDGEIYPDEFPGTRGFGCAEATHWMPLPAAPQEVKGE
ncbi:TPA: DUF551 domain-containing protein [Klebsiella oxytoca]|nr:DUF551 domain-containing protein [Klebsiella oxytoca]HCD9025525.1 DUF551 domain-containing protein [Klebsiella oxytoca]